MEAGVTPIPNWHLEIEKAQRQKTFEIGGKVYDRIPYGSEVDDGWEADKYDCHDCAIVKGQLHVVGCDVEECPACSGQALSCDCIYTPDYPKFR